MLPQVIDYTLPYVKLLLNCLVLMYCKRNHSDYKGHSKPSTNTHHGSKTVGVGIGDDEVTVDDDDGGGGGDGDGDGGDDDVTWQGMGSNKEGMRWS
jgi:hypothetical protein